MSFEARLRVFLAADPAIEQLAAGRVHPVRLRFAVPQEQTAVAPALQPSVIFSLSARRVEPGSIDEGGVHLTSTYEIDAWSTDYDTSVELADAIRRRMLQLFAGGELGETAGEATVLTVELSTETDNYDPEKGIHVRTGEYFVTHVDAG